MATLSDIAAQAGVSEATVSRVLNDKPGVSDAARQSVLTALDVLGYERPARLRRRSAGLVGLVVPELENPIFPGVRPSHRGRSREALVHAPVLCTQALADLEDEYVESLSTTASPASSSSPGGTRTQPSTTTGTGSHRAGHAGRSPTATSLDWTPCSCPPTTGRPCRSRSPTSMQLGHTRIGLAAGPARYLPSSRGGDLRHAPAASARRGRGRGVDPGGSYSVEGGAAATREPSGGAPRPWSARPI
ncbi:MAG: LacI family DNA-binding transcriptional regulator [Nocardioides sp.]